MREDYPLFTHWYAALGWILDSVEKFPKNARFSLASRISDEALDALNAIIEAIYTKNRSLLQKSVRRGERSEKVSFINGLVVECCRQKRHLATGGANEAR